MKKTLSMLLAIILLFSLCACNSNNSQPTDPSNAIQATGNSTEAPTDGTEDTTKPSDEKNPSDGSQPSEDTGPSDATDPSENTNPSEGTEPSQGTEATEGIEPSQGTTEPSTEPTAKPTEPAPTTPAHTHTWAAATCTAPKTCTTCGATEGGLADHNYANGTCSACGAAAPTEPPKATKTVYLLTSQTIKPFGVDQYKKPTSYYYNENGFLTKIETVLRQSVTPGVSVDVTSTFTVTAHTVDGLPTKIEGTDRAVTYEYDNAGKLIKLTVTRPNNYQEEYIYDETGFLLSITDYYKDEVVSTTRYEKNEQGHCTKEIFTDIDNSVTTTNYSYTYDANGVLLQKESATEYQDDDGNWTYTQTLNYSYDTAGNLVQIEESDNYSTGLTTFSYDNAGNMISKCYERYSQPAEWIDTLYTYQAIEVPTDSPLDQLDVLNLIFY